MAKMMEKGQLQDSFDINTLRDLESFQRLKIIQDADSWMNNELTKSNRSHLPTQSAMGTISVGIGRSNPSKLSMLKKETILPQMPSSIQNYEPEQQSSSLTPIVIKIQSNNPGHSSMKSKIDSTKEMVSSIDRSFSD